MKLFLPKIVKEAALLDGDKAACDHCGVAFPLTSAQKWKIKNSLNKQHFCSRRCRGLASRRRITQACGICGEEVERPMSEFRKSRSGRVFCSPQCGTIWSNYQGKKFNRPSQLESRIIESLWKDFPGLEIDANQNRRMGAELDIYLPQLNLAIEINGPHHYMPLRNSMSKLIATIKNDLRKIRMAKEADIKLYVLNSSHDRGNRAFARYYPQVRDLVAKCAEADGIDIMAPAPDTDPGDAQ